MAVVRDEDIDSELVINEVEKRPALFNKTLKDYSDANLKSKLWEEVCLNVLCTIWGQLSTEQKKQAGRFLFYKVVFIDIFLTLLFYYTS